MVKKLTLRQTGGSVTATLPKEMVDRLDLEPGDEVFAIEREDGILLTPYDPYFDEAMAAFRDVRKQYRNTLRKLAQ